MTQNELIKAVAERTGQSQAQVQTALAGLFGVIGDKAALGEKVVVQGFGTFGSRPQEATVRRNPNTGDPIHCPAGRTPFFKASSRLRDKVNGKVPVQAPALTGAQA